MTHSRSDMNERLVGLLSGAARRDSWQERCVRLTALQDRDRPGVAEHARRVADNARLLALDVGMSADTAAEIRAAALLHDIGKIAVAEAVLYKAGTLDEAERAEIRRHAAYGSALLDVPGATTLALDVTRYHHERYDGAGYFGLSGENIPYAARIAAIADVHEALTARREYKPPMPEGEALAMMTSDSVPPAVGRAAFDPFLLRRFVAMRLRDPELDADPARRTALEEFSRSDPNVDLGGRRDLSISRTGQRMHYEIDGDGNRTLSALTRADGSVMTDFPRLQPRPALAPAR